jgi:predicted TIM-barrel fold metal-dependent hydrolase
MTFLFDANAHPQIATAETPETFSLLATQLRSAGFSGACAIGLPNNEGFAHAPFLAACRAENFYPVAAWPATTLESIEDQFAALAAMGYRAIKIHPRLSGLSVHEPHFARTLRAAATAGFTVFHCSYQFGGAGNAADSLPALMDAVAACPDLRLVLLHGGTVELLRYAEAIRANRNILLDLSFTLNRFEGSSLDQDIAYLFRTFDQRICIGTDFPDYSPAQVRVRFETFSQNLDQYKKENIGWRNITAALGISAPTFSAPSQ